MAMRSGTPEAASAPLGCSTTQCTTSSCLPGSPGALLSPLVQLQFLPGRVQGAVIKVVGADHRRCQCPSEDVVAWATPLLPSAPRMSLFCVFDGHNSRAASEQAAQILPLLLAERLGGRQPATASGSHVSLLADDDAVDAALSGAFLATDAALTCDDGCTATVLLLEAAGEEVEEVARDSLLLRVANVGDSMALLVNGLASERCVGREAL